MRFVLKSAAASKATAAPAPARQLKPEGAAILHRLLTGRNAVDGAPMVKAVDVTAPGSRGGHYHVTPSGAVRYDHPATAQIARLREHHAWMQHHALPGQLASFQRALDAGDVVTAEHLVAQVRLRHPGLLSKAWRRLRSPWTFLKARVRQYQRTTKTGATVTVKEHDDRRVAARPKVTVGRRPAAAPPPHRLATLHTAGPQSPGHTFRLQPHPKKPGRWIIHPKDHPRLKQALSADEQGTNGPTSATQQGISANRGKKITTERPNPAAVIARPSSAYAPANAAGKDTEGRFKQGDAYTPERQALHRAIVAKLATGLQASAKPTFFMTGGGPASGKGNLLKAGLLALPERHMLIDADEAKKELPEYRERAAAKDASAASFVHEESAHVSQQAIKHAASNKLDAVYDSVGDSGVEKLAAKVQAMKAGGHRVVAHYVTVDSDAAVARSNKRAEKTGRFVPEVFIRQAHAQVSRIFPEAVKRGLFDEATLWDTNQGTPRKVVSAAGSKLTVHDAELWNQFLAKGTQ